VGDVEQRSAFAATGIDERANVDVARGDHAAEGGVDALERLQFLQPRDIEARRFHRGKARVHGPGGLISVLLGDIAGLRQLVPARGGLLGDLVVGLGRGQIGARLLELVVDLGGLDLGQELPGFDSCTDVHQPALEIAVGARIDRRVDVGLDAAWQDQLLHRGAALGLDHRYCGHIELARLLLQLFLRAQPRQQARSQSGGEHEHTQSYRDPA